MKEQLLKSIKEIQHSRQLYRNLMLKEWMTLSTYRTFVEELNRAEEVRFKLLLELEKKPV